MSAAEIETIGSKDLIQFAHDQIVAQIQSHFSGHERARLVDAVLKVKDWVTTFASRGPDSGVDIFAWRGSLGLDQLFLCVQGKLQTSSCNVTIYRMLQGLMQTFEGEQGLFVDAASTKPFKRKPNRGTSLFAFGRS